MVVVTSWSPSRAAARAVALHAPGSPADRRELLDMLGLLDDTGRGIRPESAGGETYVPGLENGDYAPGRALKMYEPAPHPELLTSPPGLRNLPPVAAEPPKPAAAPKKPKTPKARKPKEPGRRGRPHLDRPVGGAARCGTLAGRSRHRRLGEPVCRACLDALNEYQRNRKRAKRIEAGHVPHVRGNAARCGTVAGAKAHYRRGEQTCEECRVARRAEGRGRYARFTPAQKEHDNAMRRARRARRTQRIQQDEQGEQEQQAS